MDNFNFQPETDISENTKRIISIFLCIVTIMVLASFMWADEFNIAMPLLYISYSIITIYMVYHSHSDLCSPVFIFILFSWIGFGLKYPLLVHNPELAFFSEGYSLNFYLSTSQITYAFAFFLIGYLSFFIGFRLFKNGYSFKKKWEYGLPHPLAIMLLAISMMVFYFFLRVTYHIGVPGLKATLPLSGYILFFFSYSILLLLGFLLYRSFEEKSVPYIIATFLLFALQGSFDYMLGWKGGLAHFVLPISIIIYYLWKYQSAAFSKSTRNLVIVMIIIFAVIAVFLFPIISLYRGQYFESGKPSIGNLLTAFEKRQGTPISGLFSFVTRISGIDNFSAVTSYFNNNLADSVTNDFFLITGKNRSISPVSFYTWHILGVSEETISANAPTSWGVLFIYGGIMLIAIFFFLLGLICKYIYTSFIDNVKGFKLLIIPYAIFISSIFYNLVFEGNLLQALKEMIALIITFIFIVFVLNMIATGRKGSKIPNARYH